MRIQIERQRERLDLFRSSLEQEERIWRSELSEQSIQLRQQREEIQQAWDEWQVVRQQTAHRDAEQQTHLSRQLEFVLHQQERIQTVRNELEDQHRKTLLMRLQIEALRAELMTERQEQFDDSRLQQLQDEVAESYETSQQSLHTLREALTVEFEQARTWLTDLKKRDSANRLWVNEGLIKWDHQKSLADQARERLLQTREETASRRLSLAREQRETEQIIRNLIDQLDRAEVSTAANENRAA